MRATIESAGGVASRARVGEHELLFDQPASVPGGQGRGPSPLDALAASLGACAHYFAAAFLLARKLPVDGLRVVVDAEKVRDPSPRFAKISMQITLPAIVPTNYVPGIERAVRACPAYGTFVHSSEIELRVSLASEHAAAST